MQVVTNHRITKRKRAKSVIKPWLGTLDNYKERMVAASLDPTKDLGFIMEQQEEQRKIREAAT